MKQEKGLLLTMKERQRIEVVQAFEGGRITVEEAARVLGRSIRTGFRLLHIALHSSKRCVQEPVM